MTLEYKVEFKESDLIKDIRERLERKFPQLSLDHQRSQNFAVRALEELKEQGSNAVYEGLVKLGEEAAMRDYQRHLEIMGSS